MSSLKRTLGLQTTIAVVIGGIIGSGIFMKPALMSAELQSPLMVLSVWVVAGLITLCGALSNAEVAAMLPETGGQYVFFKKMYGDGFAFIYGWAAFAVFNTAGVASIAFIFSQYANYFVRLPNFSAVTEQSVVLHIPFIGSIYPLQQAGIKMLTILLVIIFTVVNYLSTKQGGALQRILTWLKILSLALLIGGILFSGKGSIKNLYVSSTVMPHGMALFTAYMAALAAAFWGYDGWNNITFIAGEIKNPQRNIPVSLFFGVTAVMIIYCLVNISYAYVLPVQKMGASSFVAADAATVAWGSVGGAAIALTVMLSTLGTTNGNILAIARVTFAMDKESKWFSKAGKVHPRFETPANALWINAAWTIVLIITGSFDMLTDMLIFVSWFFYGMSALGVFILRKKMPETPRAYRVWGYPVVPLFFVVFTAFFLIFTLYKDVVAYYKGTTTLINSLLGTAITCVGIPIYLLSRKKA